MRVLIQLAYAARRLLLRAFRVRTTGVKVIVFNSDGALLLVRNGYGASHLFVLPGGGVSRGESPAAAAAREMREELGLELKNVDPVRTYTSAAEGKRDTIHLFRAVSDDVPQVDGVEVIEARFCSLGALPNQISPATARRVGELEGKRPYDGRW
jgi:8-oxo-dGTP pyrophosphatase MutT (NUDIX family)